MKILHLTSHLNIGGITRYILSLTKQQITRGHHVIIASDHGETEQQLIALGASYWPLPLHTSAEFSPQVFWAAHQLAARLCEEPVDVIHAHTRVGQVVADQVTQRLKLAYVTTWHGIYRRRMGRRLWPCTGTYTIVVSEIVRRHLMESFQVPASRIRCIYNGIDTAHYALQPQETLLQQYRARWQLPSDQPIIGGIGRLAAGKVKGFDLLLVAAALLEETLPHLHVLVVGDGPRRPFLEDVARRLGIRQRVHFIGSSEDIRIPLACLDLFVFSSRWPEAFGLTLIEAMASGKPVVASRSGAVPEIIQHGVNGWLVPPNDPVAMAEGIAQLLNTPAEATRLGQQAQRRVQECFGLERMAAEIETVYQEAVSSRITRSGG